MNWSNLDLAAVPAYLRLVTAEPASPARMTAVSVALAPVAPRLEWLAGPAGVAWDEGGPATGCLWRFVRLGAANDQEILAYAAAHGVLGICRHGLPGSHADCAAILLAYPDLGGVWYWESLQNWRELAEQFRALLYSAIDLRRRRRGDPADWQRLATVFGRPCRSQPGSARQRLYAIGSYLLELARLELRLDWSAADAGADGLALAELAASWPLQSLYGALMIQVTDALSGIHGIARCVGCDYPFLTLPHRRSSGWGYCPACRGPVLARRRRLTRDRRLSRQRHWQH